LSFTARSRRHSWALREIKFDDFIPYYSRGELDRTYAAISNSSFRGQAAG
jgi:hypothetical protein